MVIQVMADGHESERQIGFYDGQSDRLMDICRPICHLFGFIEKKQKFKAVYNFLTSDLSL